MRTDMSLFVQAVSIRWYNACADYAVTLARGLALMGHRSVVAGPAGSPAVERADAFGIETLELRSRSGGDPFAALHDVVAIRRFLRSELPAVVNVHHGHDQLLWALALRGSGVPLVRTSGNQIPPGVNPFARFVQRRLTRGVIVSCGTVRRYYADGFGIPPDAIPVINGGVDTGRFVPSDERDAARDDLGIPRDALVYGIVGRFSPDKGHRYFFPAAGQCGKAHPDVWFVVAGEPAQLAADDIRSMARAAGVIDRTVFPGRQADVRALIAALDVGVITSVRSETVCRIAMEYQAMGVPVIGSDTNVIPEVVHDGVTGLIVPAGDPDALANAMRSLTDGEFRQRLGEQARRHTETELSLRAFSGKTLEAYGTWGIE